MNIFTSIINFFKRLFGIHDTPPQVVIAVQPPVPTWGFQYSPGMSTLSSNNSFDFPSVDGVHYLVKGVSSISNELSLTYKIDVTGTPVFDFHTNPNNDAPGTGTVSLYFQRKNDNFSGVGPYEYYRWYSVDKLELKPGQEILTVSLDPSKWTNVSGKNGEGAPQTFQEAVANVGAVGMVFGGGYFAGHGVFVHDGTATFTILDYKNN